MVVEGRKILNNLDPADLLKNHHHKSGDEEIEYVSHWILLI